MKAAAEGFAKAAVVEAVAADVGTDKGRAKTLAFALDKLGGLDVLVNNAGGVRAGRLEDTTEDEIRTMIEVDLVAPIMLTRAALPALRAGKETVSSSTSPRASRLSRRHSMRPMRA